MKSVTNNRENRHWLAFANERRCRHYESLKESGFISWVKEGSHFKPGDIVYLFSSKERKIIYKTQVVREELRADGVYWIENPPMHKTWRLEAVQEYTGDNLDEESLRNHGFKGGRSIQKPSYKNATLITYIESQFSK